MSPLQPNRIRILIVEDELIIAADLSGSLQGLGFEVVDAVATARDALWSVELHQPDLVLMDIHLHGPGDGISVAESIRDQWRIPVVFLTANTSEEVLRRARAADPYGFLSKPFRLSDMEATVRIAVHRHRVTHALFAEQNWLATTLASISDCVIATDREARVRYLNPAAQSLLSVDLRYAVGRPVDDVYQVLTLDVQPVIHCQLRKALQTRQPISKERFLLVTDSGVIPIEDAASPIIEQDELLGAVTIFTDITERLRSEEVQRKEHGKLQQAVERTSEALGQTRAELRALSAHLITAQEEERRRVARELHDDLGQRAALMHWSLDELAQMSGELPPVAQQKIQVLGQHLDELSSGLRQVSHRLHPSAIADLGLPTALHALAQEHKKRNHEVRITVSETIDELPIETATAFYRITQEALHNAARHAPDAPVEICLQKQGDSVVLKIEDHGPGFELPSVAHQGGLGLLSMQERARLIGGRFHIRTSPGAGTTICVTVPAEFPAA